MAGKREAVRDAVAQAGLTPARKGQDPFTGGLRRRAVLPLLVLHLISEGPSYGNQLMEKIGGMTAGVLSVNPNTIYPLLRDMEARGLIKRFPGVLALVLWSAATSIAVSRAPA